MKDIQLVRLLDVLRVTDIRNATGVSPRSVIVTGEDFTSVESVLLNGFAAPEFVVYSPTQLIAQVPGVIANDTILDVSVMSGAITLTDRSLVEFTFGTRARTVSGITKLMQTFLRVLLRTPGSNIFHPRSGGGLTKRIGNNIGSQVAADVAVSVANTRQYLINVQTSNRNLPPSERLLSAEVQALNADPRTTSIFITIVLTSHSGRRGAATLQA